MIPKIIHYCWFGGKDLPPLAKKCLSTWKDKCKDYQIMRWDESTFDVNSVPYVKEAYENKKYAFVSDYVRLWAIYKYGGIYMDTDVEVCKSLDAFLDERAFSGFESLTEVPTGIMAGEPTLPIYQELLQYYDGRHFVQEDGSLDVTTNVVIFTQLFEAKGLIRNNTKQTIADYTFYPKCYFCPKDYASGKTEITDDTYTIHHFDGSWLPFSTRLKLKVRKTVIKAVGEKAFNKMKRLFKRNK